MVTAGPSSLSVKVTLAPSVLHAQPSGTFSC
jgi:hypothetical protein